MNSRWHSKEYIYKKDLQPFMHAKRRQFTSPSHFYSPLQFPFSPFHMYIAVYTHQFNALTHTHAHTQLYIWTICTSVVVFHSHNFSIHFSFYFAIWCCSHAMNKYCVSIDYYYIVLFVCAFGVLIHRDRSMLWFISCHYYFSD